ncbi:MAG TPA: cysteine--tRNA ligase [Dehalococcoidia bacterium]|nr:cysteine--tRNA ligase [Dehalococcoidia bacterium]
MRIYNTLSGRKEEFTPGGDPIKIYVCGVTPYSECHIGHAMSYIIFDVIRRYLEFRGYRVRYVQNFTDVDDKIIARASQSGLSTQELAQKFIEQYHSDMDALNVKRADDYPRATEEIPKIIEVVSGLIESGHAYQSGNDVYFRLSSFPQYGKLSHRSLSEMMTGTSCDEKSNKEHAMDFALWKAAKPGEPQWESPWGQGRPGWHIECSAMSLKYLGETLDIHGGGQDLVFPHHENEIAQSEAFTGVSPFARYWMHNGLMQLGEEKMSKSLGNLITVKEALERYSADAIRLFVLSSHYRSPLTYTEDGLEAAHRGSVRLRLAAHRESGDGPPVPQAATCRQRFTQAMDDDFNTAQAIAALFDLASEINRAADEGHSIEKAQRELIELAGVMGLTFKGYRFSVDINAVVELAGQIGITLKKDATDDECIQQIVDKRQEKRLRREWADADEIRDRLAKLGVIQEDTPQGTVWRYKR